MTNTNGPSFNATSESGEIKQAMKIVEGDEVQGNKDASQHSTTETHVAGDMHGDIKGGDNIQGGVVNIEQAIKDLCDEMTKEAQAQGVPDWTPPVEAREIPTQETDTPEEVVFDDFESLEIPEFTDNEDHPQAISYAVSNYAASAAPMPVEEQKSLFQRAMSSVKKFATSDEAVSLGKLALSGMEATASIAPPFNIIAAVVKTGIALTGK